MADIGDRVTAGLIFKSDNTLSGWSGDVEWTSITSPEFVCWPTGFAMLGPASSPNESHGVREVQPLRLDVWLKLYDSGDGTNPWRQYLATSSDRGLTWNRLGEILPLDKIVSGEWEATATGWLSHDAGDGTWHLDRLVALSTFATGNPGLPGQPYFWDCWQTTDDDFAGPYTPTPNVPTGDQYYDPGAFLDFLPGCKLYDALNGEWIGFCQNRIPGGVELGFCVSPNRDGPWSASGFAVICDKNTVGFGGRNPENPKVFFSPEVGEWACLVNLIHTSGTYTDCNAIGYSGGTDPQDWSGARWRIIQRMCGLDAADAIGVLCHTTTWNGALVTGPGGEVPCEYDASPTVPDQSSGVLNHLGRSIYGAELVPHSNCLRITQAGNLTVYGITRSLAHDDCVIEAALCASAIHGSGMGLRVRYRASDSSNHYEAFFGNGAVGLEKTVDGSTSSITLNTGVVISRYFVHRLRIVVSGLSHKVYLDGNLAVNATDSAHASGTIVGINCQGADADIRGFSVYASESLTIGGLEPGSVVRLRTAGGLPGPFDTVDGSGVAFITSPHWPYAALEIDGVDYTGESGGALWGGDEYSREAGGGSLVSLLTGLLYDGEFDEASGTRADSSGGSYTLSDNNTVGSDTGLVHALAAKFVRANSEFLSHAATGLFNLGAGEIAFELWIKPTTIDNSTSYQLFTKDGDAAGGRQFTVEINGEGSSGTRGAVRLVIFSSDSVFYARDTPVDVVTQGAWNHIVAQRNGSGYEIYVNGVSQTLHDGTGGGSQASPVSMQATTTDVRIGARVYSGFEGYYDGLMGPVRVWNRALTSGEAASLYNGGAGLNYAGILATISQTATPGVAVVTLTGISPSISASGSVTASPGTAAVTLTGIAPTASPSGSVPATPGAGVVSLTGIAVSAVGASSATASPGTGTVTLTGVDAIASFGSAVATPGTGTVTLTGTDPTASPAGQATATPAVGTVTLAGVDPTVSVAGSTTVTPGTGTVTLTGIAPTVSAAGSVTVTPTIASVTLTGEDISAAAVGANTGFAGSAIVSLTGVAVSATATGTLTLTPGTAAVTLTGVAPTITPSGSVVGTPGVGTVTLVGEDVLVTPVGENTGFPTVGTVTLTGVAVSVTASGTVSLTPGTGAVTLTAINAEVSATGTVTAVPGTVNITLTGVTVTATASGTLSRAAGFAEVVGTAFDVDATISGYATVTPSIGLVVITGYSVVPAGTGAFSVTPGVALVTITGYDLFATLDLGGPVTGTLDMIPLITGSVDLIPGTSGAGGV